jgi:hypothetical protein
MSELAFLRRYDGINGGERTLWYEFRSVIADLINRYNIPPVEPGFLPQRGQPVANAIRPWPCGGIREPHFHYGDKVYPVAVKQWNEFTHAVIDRCQASLDMAATVMEAAPLSIDTVMTLGATATVFPPLEGKGV